MNRLRSHKFKLNTNLENDHLQISNQNNAIDIVMSSNNKLLDKLGKQYNTLSRKIRKRSPRNLSSKSPQPVLLGSYNMNGYRSEENHLEIGAPILISSTTLDTDRFDVSEERLKMIGGGIANTNTLTKPKLLNGCTLLLPSTSTSGSENEVYVDALNSTPINDESEDISCKAKDHLKFCSTELFILQKSNSSNENDLTSINETISQTKNNIAEKQVLKSVSNRLHRSELKISLQIPQIMDNTYEKKNYVNSIEINSPNQSNILNSTDDNTYNSSDIQSHNDENKENTVVSSPNISAAKFKCKSEPNSPLHLVQSLFLGHRKRFQSSDNLNQCRIKRRNVLFSSSTSIHRLIRNSNRNRYSVNNANGNSIDYSSRNGFRLNSGSEFALDSGSKYSLISHGIAYDAYEDLKSVSCQSLNPQTLFVSIDELNELTRHINESEDFNQAIDLEYCAHRDQLKPSERRITLLKNKNSKLINLTHNTERIKKSWSDVKHWFGEEGAKIREAVHKQCVAPIKSNNTSEFDDFTHQDDNLKCNVIPDTDNHIDVQWSPIKEIKNIRNPICINTYYENNELNDTRDESLSPTVKRAKQEGQNGFEELRRYIKQGGDFGKEMVLILQERIDAELFYSKSLSKLANKLNKACRELPGSVADAWRTVATEMEGRSDVHRQLSVSIHDEIIKPLKSIVDSHHKSRKTIESGVNKATRVLMEWRISEAKAKKASHSAARENEKLQDSMLDVRIQKSPSMALLQQVSNKISAEKEIRSAEKDCAKLDNKRKKAEEAVKRADVEYYTLCVRAERARVDWEMAVLRGSTLLQAIENQRLINMKNFVSNYARLTASINPALDGLVQRLQPQIENCNVVKDMQIVKDIQQKSENASEQLLPDFYCEHITLAMNRERRKHALIKLLQLVKTDLERERRSRNGLKNLSQSLANNNRDQHNITEKLYHIRSMLTYLEGARFKLQSVLLELDHKPRTSHPLAEHIQITRDRTGLQQSILKVPLWLKNNEQIESNCNDIEDSHEYENCNAQLDTSMISAIAIQTSQVSKFSTMNANCDNGIQNDAVSSTKVDNLLQRFNRSESNIEKIQGSICNGNILSSMTARNEKILSKNGLIVNSTHTHLLNDVCCDRGQADGGSNQQDSDFDEFSSQDGENDDEDGDDELTKYRQKNDKNLTKTGVTPNGYYENTSEFQQNHNNTNNFIVGELKSTTPIVLSKCKALYTYIPKLYDELELNPGDIIEVHAKQEDGWWLGELRNQIGIFPATYVEEFA